MSEHKTPPDQNQVSNEEEKENELNESLKDDNSEFELFKDETEKAENPKNVN